MANQVNALEAPLADKNEGFSLANFVIVVVGGALCARALLSSVHWFAEKVGGGLWAARRCAFGGGTTREAGEPEQTATVPMACWSWCQGRN